MQIVEVTQRYDDICVENVTSCRINITIPSKMTGPLDFYYELVGYYQNHRRYATSRSDVQARAAARGC